MRFFAAIAAVVLLLSATSTLSTRMGRYVERVEKHCAEWTSTEWEESKVQYRKLVAEYKQNYNSYSTEEREAINRAIGRYNGLYIKYSLGEAGEKLQEVGERIPALIEGFMSAFETR